MSVLSLVALYALTQAPPRPDAGLVTHLAGPASYVGASKKAAPVASFMKLRVGDEVTAAKDSQLRIVYFATGREETWTGPATLRVGDKEGLAVKGAAPKVRVLDAGTASGLRRIPSLVRDAAVARAGATVVRSAGAADPLTLTDDEKAEVTAARAQYEAARKAAPQDDIVPELAYLTALRDFQQFEEMRSVIASARQRDAASPQLKEIEEWLAHQPKGAAATP